MYLLIRNRWLIALHAIAIILITYFAFILNIFSSPSSVNYHLEQSGGYNHISEIVKLEIINRLPEDVSNNFLQKALAQNILNFFVTPVTIQKVARPMLEVPFFFVAQPTKIQNDKVVIETQQYRDTISAELPGLQIPGVLSTLAQKIVNAVPDTITLVDLEKRPNNVLGLLVKAKMIYSQISVINWVMVAVAIISFSLIVILNLHMIRQILLSLTFGYLTIGLFVLLGSWAIPYILINFVPESPDPVIGNQLNLFVNESLNYFFGLTRRFGWVYLVIALIAYLLWRLKAIDKVQKGVDKLLNNKFFRERR